MNIHEKERSALERVARAIEAVERGDEAKHVRGLLYGALSDLNDCMFPGDEIYPEQRQTEAAA